MTYQVGGQVQASDFNSFVSIVSGFNSVWGVGFGRVGYGQTDLIDVTTGLEVDAINWQSLWLKSDALMKLQGKGGVSSISWPYPNEGERIFWTRTAGSNPASPYIPLLISSLIANSALTPDNNVAASSINTTTKTQNWRNSLTFIITITNIDRYFWNFGGSFSFQFDHPTSWDFAGQNALQRPLYDLTRRIGTVTLTPIYLAGNSSPWSFKGIYRRPNPLYPSGVTPTINPLGYYQLPTSFTNLYIQNDNNTTPTVQVKIEGRSVDGPQTIYGDNGPTLEFKITMTAFNSVLYTGGTKVITYIAPPALSNIPSEMTPTFSTPVFGSCYVL